MAINKAILIGNVGVNPTINEFQGVMYAQFTLATSEKYTTDDGVTHEKTEWHTIKANGRLGKLASDYIRKGTKLYVEGTIRYRKFTDKNGMDRTVTEIQAYAIQLLSAKETADALAEADGDMPEGI